MSANAPGRLKQSLVYWCYEPFWELGRFCEVARQLGCGSIELVGPEHYPMLRAAGLTSAIAPIDMGPDPPFLKGFNNPKHHEQVLKATREAVDAASAHGVERVICFTGYADGMTADQGARHCVEGLKRAVEHAGNAGVTLCLEMLNTREDSHPMKGHPGYQGDHIDYCLEIVQRVGSPHLKLLFDFYHVQIQDGDLIRRLRQCFDHIGHIHTAGCPGRGELDDHQEIQYKALFETLVDLGYDGFVGHEFIPTRDPLTGLKEAVSLCQG